MKILKNYIIELLAIFISLCVALLEAFILSDLNLAVVIISLSTLISLTSISIKYEFNKSEGLKSKIIMIDNKGWKSHAYKKLDELTREIDSMLIGIMRIDSKKILFEELKLIRESKKRLHTIHLGLDVNSLELILPKNHEMSGLLNIYANLQIEKKRIVILSEKKMKEDKKYRNMINEVRVFYNEHGFGFENKYVFIESLTNYKLELSNLAICDDVAIVINHNQYDEMEGIIYVNKRDVITFEQKFELLWQLELLFDELLQQFSIA